ncbi:MAG: MATE family efflux transporter [Candidatus Cloacimonadota bacterium]|nr:MAG: MATE family efflux transporter [Candidatus Cloacimonadota bacterium]
MYQSIFSIAIPNILSNLSIPLLSFVDTLIIGHLDKVSYLSALALAGMIFNLLYWSFGFLRMSTTALCAQSLSNINDLKNNPISWFYRSFFMSITIGFLIILLKVPIQELFFIYIDASAETIKFAKVYFDIRIYAAPATLSLYAINGYFFGIQNTKVPLYLTVLANICNLCLNYFFVYELNYDIDGVAYATLISQYLAFIVALLLIIKSSKYSTTLKEIFDLDSFVKIIKVNTDIFIRTFCLISSFSLFTIYSSKQSDQILAINSILMQFYGFLSYGMDGLALAAETLVAKQIGLNDRSLLKNIIKKIWFSSFILSIIYTVCFYFLVEEIISILTHHQNIISISKKYFLWIVISPLINSPAYILDGIFLGAIQSKILRNAMLISFLLVFLPCLYYLPTVFANHGLWLAMSLFMVARSVTLLFYYKKLHFN